MMVPITAGGGDGVKRAGGRRERRRAGASSAAAGRRGRGRGLDGVGVPVLRGAAGPSEATRERVLSVAARLGYRPDRAASLLARRRSRLIGVLMDVRSTFHAQLVEDVHE